MGLYTSPFVLLGLANTFTQSQAIRGISGNDSVYLHLEGSGTGQASVTFSNSYNGEWGTGAAIGDGDFSLLRDINSATDVAYYTTSSSTTTFNSILSAAGGISIPSGESITGAGSLNLTGTGEFGGLFIANGGIETAGGGTAPTAFTPGATGVATVVSTTKNVVLICTAAGTQSADGEVNGTSIGAQWAAGMSFYLKVNDTITWTGTAAPTFLTMAA